MGKQSKIEIAFPVPVEFPPGFEQALDALVNMVCEKYESENPTRVMWPGGHGAKPVWREPMEPEFDDSVYQIEIAEREDLHGNNPLNPDRKALQEARAKVFEERKSRKNAVSQTQPQQAQ